MLVQSIFGRSKGSRGAFSTIAVAFLIIVWAANLLILIIIKDPPASYLFPPS
jgi:hypothetical protein